MQLHEKSEHVYCWSRYNNLRGSCKFSLRPLEETLVKCTLGLVLWVICFWLPMLTASNSQGFILPTDVRIGDIQIPHGPCSVTWTEPSGSQVRLTIKTEGRNPITLPARMVEVRHAKSGITTFVDKGVTYIQDFHTANHTFILIGTPGRAK
jgi:hypothetical protein